MGAALISVEQAERIIMDGLPDFGARAQPLDQAVGCVLRQPVAAERDQPPFDRVTMDGIAISHARLAGGQRRFAIGGTQAAGAPAMGLPDPGACIEVMTGAVLPEGCDTVIPVEQIRVEQGEAVLDDGCRPEPGQYVHRRGSDYRREAILLRPGTPIGLTEVAVLAACGLATVQVAASPRITIVSTGDELVEVGQPIAAHQVRQSNSHAIRAALWAAGHRDTRYLHLRDDPQALRRQLGEAQAASEALILSGGVSKGKFDFVPGILEELGVERRFHRVSQRPGKPMWFGADAKGTLVFALPGNPVSTLICLHRYVLPALAAAQGALAPPARTVRLAEDYRFNAPLTCFLPVCLHWDASGELTAQPRPTNTSGDFASLAGTDGFVELPGGAERFAAGFPARFHPWAGRG